MTMVEMLPQRNGQFSTRHCFRSVVFLLRTEGRAEILGTPLKKAVFSRQLPVDRVIPKDG